MNVEKFCIECLHEIFYDTTERHWCCECFAVRTILDEDGMPSLEHIPSHWIETDTIPEIIKELRTLRELREVCGMYCEQLPAEVREVLHAVPEIEKTHHHPGLCSDCGQRPTTFEGRCADCNEMESAVEEAEQLHHERWLSGEE